MVPGRITDTEVRLKISGDLPLWYKQEGKKYGKHGGVEPRIVTLSHVPFHLQLQAYVLTS